MPETLGTSTVSDFVCAAPHPAKHDVQTRFALELVGWPRCMTAQRSQNGLGNVEWVRGRRRWAWTNTLTAQARRRERRPLLRSPRTKYLSRSHIDAQHAIYFKIEDRLSDRGKCTLQGVQTLRWGPPGRHYLVLGVGLLALGSHARWRLVPYHCDKRYGGGVWRYRHHL